MNLQAVQEAFIREHRDLCTEGMVREEAPFVVRRSAGNGRWHSVSSFGLSPDNADEVIAREIQHYDHLSAEYEWKVFGFDTPPDLLCRLEKAGFEIGPKEAVMVYDMQDGLPAAEQRCIEITREDQLAEFRLVAGEVFGKDYSATSQELAESLQNGLTDHLAFLGYSGDRAVSVGRLYTSPESNFGGLYGGGTLPEFRGQGFYRSMVGVRAMRATELGARYLQVDALPTSRPILERMGFQMLTETWPCTLKRASS